MTDVNEDRGEVAITLKGNVYAMRPTRDAAKAIEKECGCTIENLIFRCMQGVNSGLTINEREVIVSEGVKAAALARKNPLAAGYTKDGIGDLLFDMGVFEYIGSIESFLVNTISGGVDPKKKKAADGAGETTKTDGATTAG